MNKEVEEERIGVYLYLNNKKCQYNFGLFLYFLVNLCYYIQPTKGNNMVEKVIFDKNIIYKLTKRNDDKLIIQYNKKNKRAFFKTDTMYKRKSICIDRVTGL